MQEMDPEYDLKTWDMSLKNMSLFKVIMDIVEAARLSPPKIIIVNDSDHISREELIIESRVIERAKNLQLPKILKTDIINHIVPVLKEMSVWYKLNGDSVCPILTPQGTVDILKSARAIFQSSGLPFKTLFGVACRYCFEDEIFDYAKRLTQDEKRYILFSKHSMENFWIRVYNRKFNKKKTVEGLKAKKCFSGFSLAILRHLYFAMERFLEMGSEDAYDRLVALRERSYVFYSKMSPAQCWMLKKVDRHRCLERDFPYRLLQSLLNWPYQHLFKKAAKTLMTSLVRDDYWGLTIDIAHKGRRGYKYFDYGELFKWFWKLSKDYRTSGTNNDIRNLNRLLFPMLRMRDKDIAFMVFDHIFESCKELIYYHFENICASLIVLKEYEVLRVLRNMSETRDEVVFLKFKNFYQDQHNRISPLVHEFENNGIIRLSIEDWNASLDEFKSVVSGWETS